MGENGGKATQAWGERANSTQIVVPPEIDCFPPHQYYNKMLNSTMLFENLLYSVQLENLLIPLRVCIIHLIRIIQHRYLVGNLL